MERLRSCEKIAVAEVEAGSSRHIFGDFNAVRHAAGGTRKT